MLKDCSLSASARSETLETPGGSGIGSFQEQEAREATEGHAVHWLPYPHLTHRQYQFHPMVSIDPTERLRGLEDREALSLPNCLANCISQGFPKAGMPPCFALGDSPSLPGEACKGPGRAGKEQGLTQLSYHNGLAMIVIPSMLTMPLFAELPTWPHDNNSAADRN